jgi:phosphoglycerate dehydrogenase-like enzyme
MIRVAVLDDYVRRAEEFADWAALGDRASVTFFHEAIAPERLTEELADYEVVVITRERARFPSAVLEGLPKLKLIVGIAPSVHVVDREYMQEQGILFCGTSDPRPTLPSSNSAPGIGSPAEMAWALIFAVTKRIGIEDRAIRAGAWGTGFPVSLRGKTLGLAGLGNLGAMMVGPARAFGMEVMAWSQNLTPERTNELGVRRVSKEELLRDSDVLGIFLVLRPHLGYVSESAFRDSFARVPEVIAAFMNGKPIRIIE